MHDHDSDSDSDSDIDADPGNKNNREFRRSRFIEESMNDSISRKPPSIFTCDRSQGRQQLKHFGSRKFRVGKSIVSAFNPFGNSGSLSDMRKSYYHNNSSNANGQDDLKVRAEMAYKELKDSGFKGTIKGQYLQSVRSPTQVPERTGNTVESENPRPFPENHTPAVLPMPRRLDQRNSIRASFTDLRRARSSLTNRTGPSNNNRHQDITSLDLSQVSAIPADNGHDNPEDKDACTSPIRKKKSRKDMVKQTRLMKEVSNLEERLEKARQELHHLGRGEGEESTGVDAVPHSYGIRKSSSRKLMAGCLPTLQSERFSGSRWELDDSDSDVENAQPATNRYSPTEAVAPIHPHVKRSSSTALQPVPGNNLPLLRITDDDGDVSEDVDNVMPTFNRNENSFYQRVKMPGSSKRKSSSNLKCESIAESHPILHPSHHKREHSLSNSNKMDEVEPRKSKLPKNRIDDSPGSVEKKQQHTRLPGAEQVQQLKFPSLSERRQSQKPASMRNRMKPTMQMSSHPKRRVSDTATRSIVEIHQQPREQETEDGDMDLDDGGGGDAEEDDEIPPVPPVPERFLQAAQNAHQDSFVVRQMMKDKDRKRESPKQHGVQVVARERVDGGRGAEAMDSRVSFQWPDGCF